jgi:hypothetical protein
VEPTVAVHFGPGRLGLGLVVDVLLSTERYEVYLIGRPNSSLSERRSYYVRFTDPRLGMRQRTVAWAGNTAKMADLPERLVAQLRDANSVLVTTALGEDNVAEAYERIHCVLQLRPAMSSTVVLVCENERHKMYDELAGANPHAVVLHCVVDRICAWDEESLLPGKSVLAHDVSQWVVPHAYAPAPDLSGPVTPGTGPTADVHRMPWPALVGLTEEPNVLLLANDATSYAHRKLWVVNGIHLILATIARRNGVDVLPLIGWRQQEFKESIRPLMLAMLETIDRAFGLAVDEHFADERVRAFCEAPDSATRVLRKRYIRSDLRPYIERLATRVGTAAKLAHDHDVDIAPFVWVFREVVEAMAESDSYLDVTVVDPATGKLYRTGSLPEVDARVDAEVEAAFARSLEGWAPEEAVDVLMRRLHNALATWRSD